MKLLAKSTQAVLWTLYALICALVLISASVYLYLAPTLPEVETLRDIQLQTPMRIFSADNELIAEFGEQHRSPLHYEQIPTQFIQALTAVEDSRFEEHLGVDPVGFARAVLTVLTTGETDGPGGSTLTQQVARNFFLTRDKTITRKFTEILLAFQMERELTKEQIFELYANKHFLGYRSYGIQAAADVYYGRDINDLTLPELAMIAGLHQAPSAANPLANPDRALRRRNFVLGRMHEMNYLSDASYEEAIKVPLTAQYRGNGPGLEAAYLAEMVRAFMVERYGDAAYTDGYTVHTTLNSELQEAATRGLRKTLSEYSRRHGYLGVEDHIPAAGHTPPEAYAHWREVVNGTPRFGGLTPAIVVRAEARRLWILPRDSGLTTLELADMEWARERIDVDTLGPAVSTPFNIAVPGDLIRVEQIDGKWQLAQIPNAQGAMVSLAPNDGSIQALVGGYDFLLSKYNRAIQANRQPGSNFKPFVYSAALDKDFTPATIVNDAPIVRSDEALEDVWRPRNSGDRYLGPIPLRQALYQSRNLSSIRVLDSIGVNYARRYAARFGFDSAKLANDMTLVLGSTVMSPLEIARGYAVFANGGYLIDPYFISTIEDNSGNVIFEANPAIVCRGCPETPTPYWTEESSSPDSTATGVDIEPIALNLEDELIDEPTRTERRYAPQVLTSQTAYLIDSMLKDVVRRGTGLAAYRELGRDDLGGKTGTTNNAVDAWFTGYNGDYVASTWVGYDNPVGLGQIEFGGRAALPGWIEFMKTALNGKPSNSLPQPVGIVRVRIDPQTGLLAQPGQAGAIFEIFKEDNAPTEYSRESVTIDFSGGNNGGDSDSSDDTITPQMLF
ncbi:penicillin-binding protein 1A [Saccharospirillum mangrovi]|uniref:penicillin-binding protein 1A n=1 Tax=Saccharospirillum mangrovi TaxID=2161747 RepID=UPI000D385D88|nr:penicillin-binding protein 1A [Saccharospirillum mangrovi]